MSGGGKAREAYGKAGGGGVETGEVDSEDTGLVELLRAHQAVIVSVQGTKNESSSEARKPESPQTREPASSWLCRHGGTRRVTGILGIFGCPVIYPHICFLKGGKCTWSQHSLQGIRG